VHINASCLPIPKPYIPCRSYCSAYLALHFLSIPILVVLHLRPLFILILLERAFYVIAFYVGEILYEA